ncbi:MAG: hypothetical protein QNJ55_15170 [Xenococcus sp. MO_188.B8]|nr:hypothetical protein [Xenococcus sp. MO_188.B8]
MSNLKDIETLEALSLDELNHVVGGRGRGRDLGRRWGKGRHKWLNCGDSGITVFDALDSDLTGDGVIELVNL